MNCKDCGITIHNKSLRCKSCSNKNRAGIKYITNQIGERNPNWSDNKITYKGLHLWIKKHKPKPEFCERCGIKPPYDLANISQKYKRDIDDFEWLCRKCHQLKDGRHEQFMKLAKRSKKGNLNPNFKGGKSNGKWERLS